MKQNVITTLLISAIVLTGCSQNASHLPSIFDIPSVIGSVFENASYNAKRKKVADYVAKHYLGLRLDAKQGGGSTLEGALDVAGIKKSKRNKAKHIIVSGQKETFENASLVADSLIQVFAALFVKDSSAKSKKINGFTYFDAQQLIKQYAENNFESLRIAIKQGQGVALDGLMKKLNIKDTAKQGIFISKAKNRYYMIYLDIVVTSIMINT
jgi:hypothetical protein